MKNRWEIKTIGDVCVSASSNVSQNKLTNEVGDYPIFGASGLIKNVSFYHQNKPYLSIVKDGSGVGRVTKMDAYTSIIGTLQYILPKDNIDLDYLNYSLMSVDFKKYVAGAAIPHIYFKDYKNEPFLWMPLPEQQRIVSILDEAFAAIAKAKSNAEQNLQNAKELFDSYLQRVFEKKGEGWEEKSLGDVFNIGSSKRILEKDWTVAGVPFYGGKEIVKLAKFGFVVSNSYISEEKYNEYALKYDMPQHGDILITARGTIGIGYIVKNGDKFYYKDGNIISMRAQMPTNPEFILYALKSNAINDQLRKLTGATVSHLPIEKAKNIVLTMPDFLTQNTVVVKIQEIEAETKRLEAIYQQKLLDLEELKKSVLQKAFSGEL